MSYYLETTEFGIQSVVTDGDHYAPDKVKVAGTIGDVIAMGDILIHDRTLASPAWRKAVIADIPDTTAATLIATPVLAIAKEEFTLVTALDTVGGILTMGECHRTLTNLSDLTGVEDDAEYCLNKTGIYLIGN